MLKQRDEIQGNIEYEPDQEIEYITDLQILKEINQEFQQQEKQDIDTESIQESNSSYLSL